MGDFAALNLSGDSVNSSALFKNLALFCRSSFKTLSMSAVYSGMCGLQVSSTLITSVSRILLIFTRASAFFCGEAFLFFKINFLAWFAFTKTLYAFSTSFSNFSSLFLGCSSDSPGIE